MISGWTGFSRATPTEHVVEVGKSTEEPARNARGLEIPRPEKKLTGDPPGE